ncbi:MAG: hypothetical protein ACOX6Q_00180 [Candidatus Dojkabacteria bacterium]|jgi:hypothetical protein
MSIFDFIFGNRISTTSFNQLRSKIVKLRKSNIYPFVENLPQAISFPYDFWKDIIKIFKSTDSDGRERAFSIFWADGEVLFTKVKTGSDRMVKSGGSVQIKYSQHPTKRDYARKELYIDGKLEKKRDVYFKNVPKSLEVQYLFNIHTHPKYIREDGTNNYHFFSAQDIKSLISSKAIMTGLITDVVWILIRTSKTPDNVDTLVDSQVTPEYLEEVLHIGLYKAKFNEKAFRYRYVKDI